MIKQWFSAESFGGRIALGKAGEGEAVQLQIDVSAWLASYPDAQIKLYVTPPKPLTPYFAALEGPEGGSVFWTLQKSDTLYSGSGTLELMLIRGENKLIKSATASTSITPSPSASTPAGDAPQTHPTWWEGAVKEIGEAKESAIASVEAAGAKTVEDGEAALVKKGKEVRESIPEDYTALDAGVRVLNDQLASYNCVDTLIGLNRPNNTTGGVSFSWDDESTCRFTTNGAAATANAYCFLFNSETSMPENIEAGKTYVLRLVKSGTWSGLRIHIRTFGEDGSAIETKNIEDDAEYTIPANAVGIRIAVMITSGNAVDGTVQIHLFSGYPNDEMADRLKSVTNAVMAEFTDFSEKKYIVLSGGIGSTVDPALLTTPTYKAAILPCIAGDVFVLTGKGGSGEARLWGFTDKNYTLMSVAKASATVTRLELIAKHDGYLIVNLSMSADSELLYVRNSHLSRYDRRQTVAIGNVPTSIYIGRHADTTGLNIDSTYAEMLAEFDKLVDGVYVKKEDLGERSRFTSYTDPETGAVSGEAETGDLPHIYCYTIEPLMYSASPVDIPTVVISASVHGDEKSATYGLMYFIKDMMEHAIEDPVLMYMRSNLRFKVIPGANPWGWDTAVADGNYLLGRFNARGVNINRNFGTSTWESYDDRPGAWEYGAKGDAAFSEPETQYIRDVVLGNPDAVLYIDWHTNGRYNNSEQYHDVRNLFVGWVANHLSGDVYARKLINAAVSMTAMVKPFADGLYGVNNDAYVYGSGRFTDGDTPTGYNWCAEATKIPAYLCETPPGGISGYLGDKLTKYSPDLIKFNAELFVNYLMKSLAELR